MRTLTSSEARAFYDRFGSRQDAQRFYEDVATAALVRHAGLEHAGAVFEFGCGTGRFAARLLADVLPVGCRYAALDVSSTMTTLARTRLASWSDRAHVAQSSGAIALPHPDGSFDRVVSTYVVDLLSAADIETFVAEAHRVLAPGGLLCLAHSTPGRGAVGRAITALQLLLYRAHPALMGGCRPVALLPFLGPDRWRVQHREVVSAWGISSEVVIAARA